MNQLKSIGITGKGALQQISGLLAAMAGVFPVRFSSYLAGDGSGVDAVVVLDGNMELGLQAVSRSLPVLVVQTERAGAVASRVHPVYFGASPHLEPCFRNQSLADHESTDSGALDLEAGDECLASKNGAALWGIRLVGGGEMHLTALAPPKLHPGEHVRDYFRRGQFMRVMPLMQFLKQVCQDIAWKASPTPACLIFDDPNQHSCSYGFINYRSLAAHAQAHHYYATFATLPLDAWGTNARVTEVLRANAPRLSLVVHGNNHSRDELAVHRTPDENLRYLAQGLRRWSRLEHQGVETCRMMEAPYGVMAPDMAEPLAVLGYEAALATPELLARFKLTESLPPAFGLDRADVLGSGFPIIPRIKMSADWETDVLLAAFLEQPIVLAAHHWDAANDYEFPAAFASLVNGLPGVVWASPRAIVRSCYRFQQQGEVLHLKMYSRTIEVDIPSDVKEIVVHRPWLTDGAEPEILIVRNGPEERFRSEGGNIVGSIPLAVPGRVEILSPFPRPVDYRSVPSPKPRVWPLVRRCLTEGRDRMAPWFFRVGQGFNTKRVRENASRARPLAPGKQRPAE